MAEQSAERRKPLRHSPEDIEKARRIPETPQTSAPAYRLAIDDRDFLCREELRPVRLQLELLKPELILQERGIQSTVVMFGGARIPAEGEAASAARNEEQKANLEALSGYYEQARAFARFVSAYSATTYNREMVIVTGGGPGIMEAGNRGAADIDAPSIGLNVVLPHEQVPNIFVTPGLCFNFHYFAIRKMHFLMRARAIAFFPGGFGTMDELFESLTLIQTGRMEAVPILLFGRQFWEKVVNFDELARQGTIAPDDTKLFHYVESGAEGWGIIRDYYGVGDG